MTVEFSVAQKQRLAELNAPEASLSRQFADVKERENAFKTAEKELIEQNKDALFALRDSSRRPLMLEIETALVKWLTEEEGFTQVVTPIILPRNMLAKMTIGDDHPLFQQVFWVDKNKCLRPMLAPNLYDVMRSLQKVWGDPVRIFEVGPCFRKESQGARHLNEFTMLNFVELAGVKEGEQMARLKELAVKAMKVVGIDNYELVGDDSVVYGSTQTLDVEVNGMEVASGAFGPHFLDEKWGIFDTWIGIGFGLERLAMMKEEYHNIKRVGRSLMYLNGARLNI
ncbi:MAG TPA: pyrrolysine--tRNA(Pyl) ligase large subunit [Clostridiales bacterium]|nr:pyrrolysine--tRNA(Pyl) ligase large subunit [Clostridiales bacterium]